MERDTHLQGIFTYLLRYHFISKALRKEWPPLQQTPIPEPDFSQLLGSRVKEPYLHGVPTDRDAAFLEPSFIHHSKSPVNALLLIPGPRTKEAPMGRQTSVPGAFLNMSSRVSSKEALPRGPLQ